MTDSVFKRGRLTLVVILLTFVTNSLYAQTNYDFFTMANKLYAEGDYAGALEKYESIIKLGYESGEIYFNMGNSYYKLGQNGNAIRYYEKAIKFLPGDEALEKNLDIVRLQIVDKIEPLPRLRLSVWKEGLLDLFPINLIAWSTFIIYMILSVTIALYIISRKTFMRRSIYIITVLFIVILAVYLTKVYDIETKQYAIILLSKIAVISEPSLGGTEQFVLHEGTKVRINRILDDYAEITLADGKTGWIKLNSLGII
jgi:tetratricopeptide (TPR) repeat protein